MTRADCSQDAIVKRPVRALLAGFRAETAGEIVRAMANHLSLRRLRDTVAAPIASAMNGAMRRGVLARDGDVVWQEG